MDVFNLNPPPMTIYLPPWPYQLKQIPPLSSQSIRSGIQDCHNNNQMKFGDIFSQQLQEIVMSISSAPIITNLIVSLHEQNKILPKFLSNLYFCSRFIDDGFMI